MIRKRGHPQKRFADFMIVGVLAHYSDESCEPLPFSQMKMDVGCVQEGNSTPAGCSSPRNLELDLISSEHSPRSLPLGPGHPEEATSWCSGDSADEILSAHLHFQK